MFTEYTKEEIEKAIHIKAEGFGGESFKVASQTSNENLNLEDSESGYHTNEYNNSEALSYDLDGESLW